MATFLLIHGSWHGGWCWEEVVPRLKARGHRVLAPDQPGMGSDRTPFAGDVIAQWTDALAALLAVQPEPAVLVGHSRGGLLVGTLAERMPERVRLAVYVSGVMVPDGMSMFDAGVRTPAVEAAMHLDEATGLLTLDPEGAQRVLYNGVAPDVAERAASRLCAEPMKAFTTPLHLTEDRYGRVPRAYVENLDDLAIPVALQRQMQARWPCAHVVSLPSGHSPFYAVPERLAEVLDGLAGETRRAPVHPRA